MSTYARASAVNGSDRLEGRRAAAADEESSSSRTNTPCLKAVRPKLRTADPAGEGRSSGVEPPAGPALPGRKAHRKAYCKDSRGRRREGHRDEDEARLHAERETGRERGTQRLGEKGRTEPHGAAGGRGSSESLSSSNSDVQLSSALEAGEGPSSFHRPHGCSSTSRAGLKPPPPPPTARSRCSALAQPPIQTRPAPLAPQRPPPRTSVEEQHRRAFSASRESDPFWVEVRSGAGPEASSQSRRQTRISSLTSLELGGGEEEEEEEQVAEEEEALEDDEEEGGGVVVTRSQTVTSASAPPCAPFAESGISKRERNRIKCLRRRQRRKERWRQSQLQEGRQSSPGIPSSSSSSGGGSEDDEDLSAGDREGYICAVCLDVYFSPYMCHPCNHVFCEPCLRTLAKSSPTNTPCPLCRTIITHVFFQKELNQSARTFFPKEYLSRKQNFQKASCAKWPLPSCRKLFRIFGGFQRQASPVARRQIPHGGRYRLDAMDFRDDARGWRLDMVIIYIFSVNWAIGFFILCFICYLFFPSL